MADGVPWGPLPSVRSDVENLLHDLPLPSAFRREVNRVLDDSPASPRVWRDVDRLLHEHELPPALRRRIATRLLQRLVGSIKQPLFEETYAATVDLDEREVDLRADDDHVLTMWLLRQQEPARGDATFT